MRFRELVEGRDAPLYHGSGFRTAVNIIKSNTLKGYDAPISVTRDRRFAHFWGQVVFVLDQQKLSNSYKIFPYKDGNRRHEAEERIPLDRPIFPLDSFLLSIEVSFTNIEKIKNRPEYQSISTHPLLKVVPDITHPSKWIK